MPPVTKEEAARIQLEQEIKAMEAAIAAAAAATTNNKNNNNNNIATSLSLSSSSSTSPTSKSVDTAATMQTAASSEAQQRLEQEIKAMEAAIAAAAAAATTSPGSSSTTTRATTSTSTTRPTASRRASATGRSIRAANKSISRQNLFSTTSNHGDCDNDDIDQQHEYASQATHKLLSLSSGTPEPAKSRRNNNKSTIPGTSSDALLSQAMELERQWEADQLRERQAAAAAAARAHKEQANAAAIAAAQEEARKAANTRSTADQNALQVSSQLKALDQRRKLEEEIRAMEEALQANRHPQQQQSSSASSSSQRQQPRNNSWESEQQLPASPMQSTRLPAKSPKSSATQAAFDQRQKLEAEIRAMENAIAQAALTKTTPRTIAATPPAPPPARPTPPPSGGNHHFLSGIAQAANERDERVQHDAPRMQQVEQTQPKSPAAGSSMAELVSQGARAREERLAAGGEKKMTKLNEKQEIQAWKNEFKNICVDAASMGRLTRLNEHVVEAVATEKTPTQEWKSAGLLAIQWQSSHMSVIHEAAELGNMTKEKEVVTTNYGIPEEEEVDEEYWESHEDAMSPRMQQLLEIDGTAGGGRHKVELLIRDRREANAEQTSLLIRPMWAYQDAAQIETMHLPKARPPKIDPLKIQEKLDKKAQQQQQQDPGMVCRPMTDISNVVAAIAWERRTRLDRPGSLPKVQEKCPCPYCVAPSPYQTYAYLVLEKRLKDHPEQEAPLPPPPQPEHRAKEHAVQEQPVNEEQPKLVESEKKKSVAAGAKDKEPTPKRKKRDPAAASGNDDSQTAAMGRNKAPEAAPPPPTPPPPTPPPPSPPPPTPPPPTLSPITAILPTPTGSVSGELKKWHKITLSFEGPQSSESAIPNPFTYYRCDVAFAHSSGTKYTVPGYFAADGNAANTGATEGNVWMAHFAPDKVGTWTWEVFFTEGLNVAQEGGGNSAGFFDGQSGSFSVSATDKRGRDHRGKGRLEYVGEHHLQFAETGEWFLKGGADSPENFLAYEDFDNTPNNKELRKSWAPHVRDFNSGDPSWADGKGAGIIGAVNYLSEKGMNVFSFLTMNIKGDDRNVFPYVNDTDFLRFDVSKTAQWEIVFEHADKKGMFLHFKTQEQENDQLLDGGVLGLAKKLYYRELIARFSHHLALNWNLGEENTNSDSERKSFANYVNNLDPYKHPIVVHTFPDDKLTVFTNLLNFGPVSGVSMQARPDDVIGDNLEWVKKSADAGHKWVVGQDENGPAQFGTAPDSIDIAHDNVRQKVLWGSIMAGGAGVEFYFGYQYENSDLTCEDYRSRETMWDQTRHALEFFRDYMVPFWTMSNANELVTGENNWCRCWWNRHGWGWSWCYRSGW